MNKILSLFICFFCIPLLFSQEVELKKWAFYSEKDTTKIAIEIPHTWNTFDAFDDEPGYWRGKGYYTTEVTISNISKLYFLHFNGVNQHSKVWVNNLYVGEHKGGYTAFDLEISKYLILGKNSVTVEVDNSHNETIPPLDADFTFYGGIYRSVYLIEENPVHFEKINGADAVKIDALLEDNWQGKLEINGIVFNKDENSIKYKIRLDLRDSNNKLITSIEENIDKDFKLLLNVKDPFLWSPTNPNLYSIELNLLDIDGNYLDAYKHKIGFRKFETSTNGFFLNGNSLKLIGVNRHQDWDKLSNAVPIKSQFQDLVMIKEMGCNFLRLAHYPQDKAIYKAADSLGLILWSEIPVVNKVPVNEDYVEYKENSIQMQNEHIAQNYNHPSLIFIGYMNEIFLRMVFDKNDEETRRKIIENSLDLATQLENLTRKEAPNHTTVMALHGNQIYNDTGIANIPMVIGWNLYYGWYEGDTYDLGGFLDKEFEKYPNRPLIISEYGVGADQRLHNSNPKKFDFSEEYQFEYHPGYYNQIMERRFVVGMSAWNFADFGSEFRGDAMPHINQKGLVNFNREPKNIYYWYKTILKPEERASCFFKGLSDHINDSPIKEIIIISNQDIFLKVNKKERKLVKPVNGIIKLNVELKAGENTLRLFDNSEKLLDTRIINYHKPDFSKSNILAISFGTESYFMDSNKQVWIPSKEVINLKIEGLFKVQKSSTNIRNTFEDPIYQSSINNVKKIQLVIPKGMYRVTVLIAELNKDQSQIYELGKNQNSNNQNKSNNNIVINGKQMSFDKILLFHKNDISVVTDVDKELLIESQNSELFSISGILINKIK